MSSEALNLTSKLIVTPQKKVVKIEQPLVLKEEVKIPRNDNVNKSIVNEAALRQNFVKLNTSKKTCVNILNKRLYSSKKKDMIKNKVIIFSLFFSVGIFGFILG
jgi:hypothetical protein